MSRSRVRRTLENHRENIMNRLYEWWTENRQSVGMAVGIGNLAVAGLFYSVGDSLMAAFWFCLAIFVFVDTWSD